MAKKLLLLTAPPASLVTIDNIVTTKLDSNHECPLKLQANQHNHYYLSGCLDYQNPTLNFDIAIKNPHYLLNRYLSQRLNKHKIHLQGHINYLSTSAPIHLLASHRSAPLHKLIKHMLKKSDNLYANIISKTVGAIYLNKPATWKNGAIASIALLKQLNIDTTQINIIDGAGLSRYDRISPQGLLQILNYNYHHPTIGHYFYNGLLIDGTDDKSRPLDLGLHPGYFHAKTGSMQAVATIAGYLKTIHGTSLAVVIRINGNQPTLTYFGLIRDIVHSLATSKI